MDPDGLNGLGLGPTDADETSRCSKSSRWFGKTQEQTQPEQSAPVQPDKGISSKQDAARSLLEMLQKGVTQPPDLAKVVTAEELERSTGNA